MVKLKLAISGVTVIEVLIALVVIMTTFFIFSMIYVNTLRTTLSENDLKANLIAFQEALLTRSNKTFFDQQLNINGLQVDKKVSYYQNNQKIIQLNITVRDSSGEQKAIYNELIKI